MGCELYCRHYGHFDRVSRMFRNAGHSEVTVTSYILTSQDESRIVFRIVSQDCGVFLVSMTFFRTDSP
jgi:hypothetical protein